MAFASIKSEVYYLKLLVGKENRVIKVVAVLKKVLFKIFV